MKMFLLTTAVLSSTALGWEPAEAPTKGERDLVSAVIVAEAGGEGATGMQSVYEVLWKRASLSGRTYTQVVTRRHQFECITGRKHSEFIAWAKGKWPDQFKEVQSMLRFPPLTVHTVPAGQRKTNTNRADHYFALKSMPKVGGVRTPPYWSKSYNPVKDAKGKTVGWRFNGKGKIVGNHTFERHR